MRRANRLGRYVITGLIGAGAYTIGYSYGKYSVTASTEVEFLGYVNMNNDRHDDVAFVMRNCSFPGRGLSDYVVYTPWANIIKKNEGPVGRYFLKSLSRIYCISPVIPGRKLYISTAPTSEGRERLDIHIGDEDPMRNERRK